jgi:hypothetical protein
MKTVVSLARIVDALETLFEGCSAFVNRRTGEVVTCTHDELRAAEEEPASEESASGIGWEREAIEAAKKVLSDDDFLELPDKFDIHEWALMESFCLTLEDEELRDELLSLLHGAGAFRRFKHAVDRYGMTDGWYRFRAEAIEEIARDWLEANGIPFGP